MHTSHNPEQLAQELNKRFRDQTCMVILRHGEDHLGKARMQINKIYYDADVDTSHTLRIIGYQTGNTSDHAMFAVPWRRGDHAVANISEADHVTQITAGQHLLQIIPMAESTGY